MEMEVTASLNNRQPPSPKSPRGLPFTLTKRGDTNLEIESMKASTPISPIPPPARPRVDNKKSDRKANSTPSNDKGFSNDPANRGVRVLLLQSSPPKCFEERCLESVVDCIEAVSRSGVTEGLFYDDAVVGDFLLFSREFCRTD